MDKVSNVLLKSLVAALWTYVIFDNFILDQEYITCFVELYFFISIMFYLYSIAKNAISFLVLVGLLILFIQFMSKTFPSFMASDIVANLVVYGYFVIDLWSAIKNLFNSIKKINSPTQTH